MPDAKDITIDIEKLYSHEETAKLDSLPVYESNALNMAGSGNNIILTGRGPVWLYLRLAHTLHGVALSLSYESPVTGAVSIFNHNPR